MVSVRKKHFYYSAILLGITCFPQDISAAQTVDKHQSQASQHVKYQSFREKPEEKMSWAEWLASGITPTHTLEEAVHDPKFYEALAWDDLTQEMKEIKKDLKNGSLTQEALQEKLTECYGLVKAGLVSPQAYFKFLSELPRTEVCSKMFLKNTSETFREDLKNEPELLKQYIVNEMAGFLGDDFTQPHWTRNVAKTLHFYGQLESPLDHLTVINHIGGYVAQRIQTATQDDNKEHKDTLLNQLKALNRAVAISMTRLTKEDPDYMSKAREAALKEAQDRIKAQAETNDQTSDFLPESPSEKTSFTDYFKSFAYEGGKLVYKGMKFAINNPGQTLTMMLAAQVTAAAAYNSFAVPQEGLKPNSFSGNYAKRGGSSAITSFTWPGTGSSSSVAAFNDPQNLFLVTDSTSSGVEVYPFYSNGTSYGPSSLVSATGSQPTSVGLSNAVGVGYYDSQNYYFNNIILNGTDLQIASPVQINTASGILNNLGFAPISSGNPLFPDGTLFAKWSIQVGGIPEGRAGLIFPNQTVTPETSIGCVINSIIPVSAGGIYVLCTTTSSGQPIVQGGDAVFDSLSRTFTFDNAHTILANGTFATPAEYDAVAPSNNNILLGYINSNEKVSVMEFTQNGIVINPSKVVYTSTASDTQGSPILVPVPGKGDATLWGSQIFSGPSNVYGSFTTDDGASFATPVQISPFSGGLSATYVGDNNIAVVAGINGSIVPVSVLDTGTPTPPSSASTITSPISSAKELARSWGNIARTAATTTFGIMDEFFSLLNGRE